MEVTISDYIAGLAFALSIYTVWRQHGLDRLNRKLNALLIEKEEADTLASKRADLSANFVKTGKHNYEFRIYNRGKGPARNVTMEVLAGGDLLDNDLDDKFPFPSLDVHQSISLLAMVHMQSPRRATVRLKWQDDAGGGEKDVTADVF
jgi:hypothetical protein